LGNDGLEDAPAGLYAQVVEIPARKVGVSGPCGSQIQGCQDKRCKQARFSSRRRAMIVLYWPFGRDFALRASEF